jgi:hypothetical protein
LGVFLPELDRLIFSVPKSVLAQDRRIRPDARRDVVLF